LDCVAALVVLGPSRLLVAALGAGAAVGLIAVLRAVYAAQRQAWISGLPTGPSAAPARADGLP
jgi:hypothetical protein